MQPEKVNDTSDYNKYKYISLTKASSKCDKKNYQAYVTNNALKIHSLF